MVENLSQSNDLKCGYILPKLAKKEVIAIIFLIRELLKWN